MKLIKFRRMVKQSGIWRDNNKPDYIDKNGTKLFYWEIAFNEKHLNEKLSGDMAEVIMPAKPWWYRLWIRFIGG